MKVWPLSDNITVSLISGAGAISAAVFAWRVQRSFKRDDVAAAGLTAQIGGWKELTNQLREYADDLDEKLQRSTDDCDRRLKAIEKEMRWHDEQCESRMAALEKQIAQLKP